MSNEFEIRRVVALDATPEEVWRAIATPEGQAAWSPDPYASAEGVTVEADEPARLEVRTPEAPDGAFHAFEYLIEAQQDGTTILRFVHSGFLGDDWDAEFSFEDLTARGWDMYLHTLAQYLEHFAGRPATYVEAQAPPSTADPAAWPVLESALGLVGPVGLGDEVRLEPSGLPVVEGVVDYVEPAGEFLAVRAADGLYRFHGMAAMGMPIAVGHYLYEAGVDRERTQAAWRDWLERVFA
jgi:uncharacterized protein YndB with AHSA1/START domain